MTAIPIAWVERLFSRFAAMYGAQKVAAMWQGADIEEVKRTWADQLGRFPPAAMSSALQAVVDSGKEWPPTLPEFVALCKEFNHPESAGPALPAPRDREKAAVQLARIKEMLHGIGRMH